MNLTLSAILLSLIASPASAAGSLNPELPIAASDTTPVFMRSIIDGRVFRWGARNLGTGIIEIRDLKGARDLSLGEGRLVAALADGTVVDCRLDRRTMGLFYPIDGLKDIVKVAATKHNGFAVSSDGKLYAWGRNQFFQFGAEVPTPIAPDSRVYEVPSGGFSNHNQKIAKLEATESGAVAVLTDTGALWTWGNNARGALGVSAGQVGEEGLQQWHTLDGIVDVVAGGDFFLALNHKGEVFGFGNNDHWQLGNKDAAGENLGRSVFRPTRLPLPGSARRVVANATNSLILLRDGRVYGAGYAGTGVLAGHVAWTDDWLTELPELQGAREVVLGGRFGFALRGDWGYSAWGWNEDGSLAFDDGTDGGSAVVAPRPVVGSWAWLISSHRP